MIYQGSAKYPVREIILHCAALRTGQFQGFSALRAFSEINRWHMQKGWSGIGYHGLVMPDGEWFACRAYSRVGAHCLERNRGSLGFLLIEQKEITGIYNFDWWFTQQQRETLRRVIRSIHGIERVSGHNDYAQKLCPGFKVQTDDWL